MDHSWASPAEVLPIRQRPSNHDYVQSSSSRRNNPTRTIATVNVNPERDRNRDRNTQKNMDYELMDRAVAIPPASPEVISSLITSLSVISKRTSHHFDGPPYLDKSPDSRTHSAVSLPVPDLPTGHIGGSFGVDYGAFVQPSLVNLQEEEDVSLDELAASPPVVRIAKPPSGLSPLTASRSPNSPGSRDGPGLKNLLSGWASNTALNGSRPSSRGSLASAAETIGNLSIERGLAAPTSPGSEGKGPTRQRSHDSWGKKTGRSSRGLMYMSSKEALREKEAERKRASIGGVGGSNSLYGGNGSLTGEPESALVETVINEEVHGDSSTLSSRPELTTTIERMVANPRLIPVRDSSLCKTGPNAKRASAQASSRSSKRDDGSDGGGRGRGESTIHEFDEHGSGGRIQREGSRRHHYRGAQLDWDPDVSYLPTDASQKLGMNASFSRPNPGIYGTSPVMPDAVPAADMDTDEGAPSPAIAQGRRRDRDSSTEGRTRRRSGRQTPDPLCGYISEGGGGAGSGGGGITVRLKRSSSRLKRLSSAASPTPDKASDMAVPLGTSTQTDQPHVAYERPRSADSVDDAVGSYLCSPRLSQKIRHPQTGRVISFSEVGDPNGSAVFCCVGMGLTRYITAFYDELALTLKLRLITPDRPGVGDSEPYVEGTATPLSWPDDVYAIYQSLKITKFSILAHSAGAIYALATALRMPQHIRGRIHLLAPWIPPSQMSVFGASAQTPLPPINAIPTSQRILRALPTPILKAANSSFMTATSSSITSSLPKQKRTKREKRSRGKAASSKETRERADVSAGGGGTENKENQGHGAMDIPQLSPVRGVNVSERMDHIRPTGTADIGAGRNNSLGQRHHGQLNSSEHHQPQQDAVGSQWQSAKDEHVLSTAASLATSQPTDRERQRTYDDRLTHAIWQLATTGANPAVDLLVCLERRHTIGFRYVDITRPVVIHHGTRDTRVPIENVKWLGKTMRRCEVRVLEGEGHGLMASALVMGNVLMEVSREWEEWGRVTGATRREHERTRRGTIGQAK